MEHGEGLIRLRNWGLLFFVFVIACFPFLSASWDFVRLLAPDFASRFPWLIQSLDFLDASGQRVFSRSLLRILLIGGCLLGLLLPLRCTGSKVSKFDAVPWLGLFLLSGLISVSLASGPFVAVSEWETWALLLLFGLLVKRAAPPGLGEVALFGLYASALLVYIHALWISVPASVSRLGGVFQHPNALSTYASFCLPFFLWRSGQLGRESGLAAFLAGAILAIQLWTGSLTGACLLIGGLAFWLGPQGRRPLCMLGGSLLPLLFNLAGGWLGALSFPLTFLSMLLLNLLMGTAKRRFSVIVIFLLSLTFTSAAFSLLAPLQRSEGVVSSRTRSLSARLKFYRASLEIAKEAPVFGVGPSGFARVYPKVQSDVRYFSRFVHCLPLEFLVEWGVLGFALGTCVLIASLRAGSGRVDSDFNRAFRWSGLLFFLHCLTDVQSQFPYLLCLVVVAWAVWVKKEKTSQPTQNWIEATARVLISLALLLLLILNGLRISASLDRDFALSLHRSSGQRARTSVESLLKSSISTLPLDGESKLLLGQLYRHWEELSLARTVAEDASQTDSNWATPRLIFLSLIPLGEREDLVEEALQADPVNYPGFYLFQAEELVEKSEFAPALELLHLKSRDYRPSLLAKLPPFRAEDISEQLVEFWLLTAILEEYLGNEREAEAAFRKSLFFSEKRLSRLQRLTAYPRRVGLLPGLLVQQLLGQVADQIPAK